MSKCSYGLNFRNTNFRRGMQFSPSVWLLVISKLNNKNILRETIQSVGKTGIHWKHFFKSKKKNPDELFGQPNSCSYWMTVIAIPKVHETGQFERSGPTSLP